MARINLLPWRDALRKERKREFFFMLIGGVVIAGLMMFYWHLHNERLIDNQRQRNALLKREISVVEREIKEIARLEKVRNQLVARMRVIQDLQGSRPQVVHLFDEMVETLPDGIYLQKLGQSGSGVSVIGRAQSNARVSAYMRNIEQSPWLALPRLGVIENTRDAKSGDGMSSFTMSAQQVVPKAKEGGKP